MKKVLFIGALLFCLGSTVHAQVEEYKVVTVVESIVPGGLGRSRIVENQGDINIDLLTSERDGKKATKTEAGRSVAKEAGENARETKLLNFYSLAGINFGNIASNDAIIAAKINEVCKQGYRVAFITSAVESDAGKEDGVGIFITRIFFVKL